MAQVFDRDEPRPGDPLGPGDFDFSDLRCPGKDCGSNDVTIVELPADTRATWWGSGRARCNFCGRSFPLVAEPCPE